MNTINYTEEDRKIMYVALGKYAQLLEDELDKKERMYFAKKATQEQLDRLNQKLDKTYSLLESFKKD